MPPPCKMLPLSTSRSELDTAMRPNEYIAMPFTNEMKLSWLMNMPPCVKVKDYSAAGVFQTHTGDNDFVALRVVSGVCRNCAHVDDSARDIKRA
jgi:hypothetical protein